MALTRFSRIRHASSVAALLMAAAGLASTPGYAQEEGPDAPDTGQPGYSSLNVAQPKGTRELQNALQRLALDPADIDALIDGGNAALLLGDPQAAIGFFARADEMAPGNGRVKAGLGSAILLNENPYEALRLFEEAKRLGVPETVFASDRGLAYDLVGNSNAALADYELALRRGSDDETIRRYALSLGISGDRLAAEAQLDPLLRKRDAAAWRTRAFVLAVTGDPQGAIAIADATMPKRMAASIEPFFRFMGRLTPAQQAAAAHFGQFPQSAAIGKDDPRNRQYASIGAPRVRSGRADSGLIPVGEPLGPSADSKARKTAKVDKSIRRRPGRFLKKEREAIALAQAEAAARPVEVQARAPGPVPPSDLLIPRRGSNSAMVQAVPGSSSGSAMVQPIPGQGNGSAMVQPIPGQGSGSAMVQPMPSTAGTASSARAAIQQTAQSDRPAQTAPINSPPNPPTVMASVRESVRRPGPAPSASTPGAPPAGTLSQVSRTSGAQTTIARQQVLPSPVPPQPQSRSGQSGTVDTQSAGATFGALANAPADTQSSTSTTAKPVLLAGMSDLPRPGFTSVPPVSSPSTGSAPSQAVGSAQVQSLPASQSSTPPGAAEKAATGFDLARMGPIAPAPETASLASSSPPPAAIVSATPAPERISLSAVIASITVPPQELVPDENAVDITKLKPAPPKVDPKLAEAKKLEAKKAEEKKAAAKKAAAKPAPPKHPKRYWVQVAGGANRADLAKEWKRLTGEAPAVFKGKQGWWTPLNATNRLLTGPFSGPNEAQSFVNTLSKSKLSGFAFTSPEGQEVTKLGS